MGAQFLSIFRGNRVANSFPFFARRTLPTELSPSYSYGFLSVHAARSLPREAICTVSYPSTLHFRSLPCSSEALPRLFPTVSCPSTLHARFVLLINEITFPKSQSYFQRFPFRSRCFLAPKGARSKLFPIVSCPSALLSRSLPTELSPSYFPRLLSPLI